MKEAARGYGGRRPRLAAADAAAGASARRTAAAAADPDPPDHPPHRSRSPARLAQVSARSGPRPGFPPSVEGPAQDPAWLPVGCGTGRGHGRLSCGQPGGGGAAAEAGRGPTTAGRRREAKTSPSVTRPSVTRPSVTRERGGGNARDCLPVSISPPFPPSLGKAPQPLPPPRRDARDTHTHTHTLRAPWPTGRAGLSAATQSFAEGFRPDFQSLVVQVQGVLETSRTPETFRAFAWKSFRAFAWSKSPPGAGRWSGPAHQAGAAQQSLRSGAAACAESIVHTQSLRSLSGQCPTGTGYAKGTQRACWAGPGRPGRAGVTGGPVPVRARVPAAAPPGGASVRGTAGSPRLYGDDTLLTCGRTRNEAVQL